MTNKHRLMGFRVTGFCEDEHGERFKLNQAVFVASTRAEAREKARDEMWDNRLDAASCYFVATIEALDTLCEFCSGQEAPGECDHCGAAVCEECHGSYACCDERSELDSDWE